jgi:DNA-binding NtrC family response regulator
MNDLRIPVLIVDDEESIHRALDRTLRREPYELLHASDAGEAEAILNQRADVRAVVCDHYMPGLPGLEFLLHLRRSRPRVVAILLTAQADIQMALTAINEGRLHRFFTKPWDGVELRGALRKLLYLDPEQPDERTSKLRAEEERLRQDMAPRRDPSGAWVIETPEGLPS